MTSTATSSPVAAPFAAPDGHRHIPDRAGRSARSATPLSLRRKMPSAALGRFARTLMTRARKPPVSPSREIRASTRSPMPGVADARPPLRSACDDQIRGAVARFLVPLGRHADRLALVVDALDRQHRHGGKVARPTDVLPARRRSARHPPCRAAAASARSVPPPEMPKARAISRLPALPGLRGEKFEDGLAARQRVGCFGFLRHGGLLPPPLCLGRARPSSAPPSWAAVFFGARLARRAGRSACRAPWRPSRPAASPPASMVTASGLTARGSVALILPWFT